MYNVKLNKKIADYLLKQLKRLKMIPDLSVFFEEFIIVDLSVADSLELAPKIVKPIEADIFDNDSVLIETLKVIGLMEACKDQVELNKLLSKRDKIKGKDKKETTDFDKILKGIMKVPGEEKTEKRQKKS